MTEPVGSTLKAAREARGLSISEVAQSLKFAPRQLEALEQERFELLPGGTFVRGMVRSYARLLKLEPESLLAGISGRFEAPDANHLAARYSQPVPFSDSARRSTFVYLGVSLAVLALGGGVAYQWYREHNASVQVAAAKRPAEKRAAAPRAQPKTIEEPPRTEAVVKVATERPGAIEKAAAEKPAAPSVAKAPVPVAKVASGVHRLVIRCEEEAWIEVKDSNERMLVSSLNPKGAERVVQARGPLTLVIGNAAHVRVLHNDRPVDLAPHTKLAIARFTLP
jgi:cytoskeleton protein RodZ